MEFDDQGDGGYGKRKWKNYSWSKMLAKVFKVDVLKCEECGGLLRPICAVQDKDSVRRYLKSVDLEYDPPPRGPPRFTQPELEFDEWDQNVDQSSQVHQEG